MSCSRCKESGHNIATCDDRGLNFSLEYEKEAEEIYLKIQNATTHNQAINIIQKALVYAKDDGASNPYC